MKGMQRPTTALALLAGATFFLPAPAVGQVGGEVMDLGARPLPMCTFSPQRESLEAAQLGVDAQDELGEDITGQAARKFGPILGKNWYPLEGRKRVMCGIQDSAAWFRLRLGWPLKYVFPHEDDWNVFIEPSSPFDLVFNSAVRSMKDPSKTQTCWDDLGRSVPCLEAELNVDQSLYAPSPYPIPAGLPGWGLTRKARPVAPLLDDRVVCTYGPWVREEGHDDRPEIHPIDAMWWEDDRNGDRGIMLAALLDDSERFDSNRYFRHIQGSLRPPAWRPWARSPKQIRFDLRLAVSTDDFPPPQEHYRITPGWPDEPTFAAIGVVTPNGDDGPTHRLRYAGRDRILVHEFQPDEALDFTWQDACLKGDSIIGTASVTTVIERSRDVAGAHAFRLSRGSTPLSVQATLPTPAPGPGGEWRLLPESVRWDPSTNSVRGDAFFEPEGGLRLTAGLVPLAATSDPAVTVEQRPDLPGPALVGLPLIGGGSFDVTLSSDRSARLELPPLGLELLPIEEDPTLIVAPGEAWASLAEVTGAEAVTSVPGTVLRAVAWEVRVLPVYSTDPGAGPEGQGATPVTAILNEILFTGDSARIASVFGTDEPFDVEWSATALDLTEPEVRTLSVVEDEPAGTGSLGRESWRGEGQERALRVEMPTGDADHYVEVRIDVSVFDRYENRADWTVDLGSQVLTAGDPASLARGVVRHVFEDRGSEADPGTFFGPAPDPGRWEAIPEDVRLGRLAATTALVYAQDVLIDRRELTALRRILTGAGEMNP